MATIVHFDIPIDDPERAKNFYIRLFGWKIQKFQGPMEYWLINTTDREGEESIAGGMIMRQYSQQPIINYIDVPSIDEALEKIEKLGGKVTSPKTSVPGVGYFARCLDTENNAFAIWESDKNAS